MRARQKVKDGREGISMERNQRFGLGDLVDNYR